jgi:hypothetical protein
MLFQEAILLLPKATIGSTITQTEIFESSAARCLGRNTILPPLQHPQPATRVQYGQGAVLKHSKTPPRASGFEDDDENEAPGEGGDCFGRFPGPKPWAVLLNHLMVRSPSAQIGPKQNRKNHE